MPTIASILFIFFIYIFGCIGQSVTLTAIFFKTEQWSKKSGLLLIFSLACTDLLKCVLIAIGSLESLIAALNGVSDFPALASMNRALGFVCDALWLTFTFHLVLMAVNRFVALYLPFRFSHIFSPSNTKKMLFICWLLSVVFAVLHEFICCPQLWQVQAVAFGSLPVNETYKFTIADHIITFATVIFSSILYVFIAFKLMMMKKEALNQERQAIIDPKLCLQYALIILVYAIMCIIFQVTRSYPSLNFLATIVGALNYSVTPVIYWLFNKPIREAIGQLLQHISNRCGTVFPENGPAKNEQLGQNHVIEVMNE